MFARSQRGMLDFLAAALCLWAAAWHTPAGALVRGVVAKVTDSRTTARPLLAYYSGGVYGLPRDDVALPAPWQVGPEVAVVPAGDAVGRGVLAAMSQASPSARRGLDETARRYGRGAPATPDEAAALLAKVRAELPGDEVAVLALFGGVDVARFAAQRVAAEGREPTLEALAARLPPGSGAVEAASAALMLGTAYGLSWPVSPATRISSPFGNRDNPVTGRSQLHTGVDLVVPEGTPVFAVADGVVRRAGEDSMNGRIIVLDHGRGVWTAYCHNSELLVATGQRVKLGDTVSRSGNTGRSTGAHLHYQLELAHRPYDPFLFRAGRPPPERVAPLVPAAPVAPVGPTGAAPRPKESPDRAAALKAAFEQAGKPPELGGTDVEP